MTSQNQEKLLFSALILLVHFRETLLSQKLFGSCWIQERIGSVSSAKQGQKYMVTKYACG
jgi:hypothetical protein